MIGVVALAVVSGVALWRLAAPPAPPAPPPFPDYLSPLPAPTSAPCAPAPCASVDGLQLTVSQVDRDPPLPECAQGRAVIRVDLTFTATTGTHEVIAGSGLYLLVDGHQVAPDFSSCLGQIPLQTRLGAGAGVRVTEYFDARPPAGLVTVQWYPDVPVPYGHRRLPVTITVRT